MSAWEMQLLQSVDGMSEIYRQPLLEIIKVFRESSELGKTMTVHGTFQNKGRRKPGIAKEKTLITEGYDFDECNGEITEMFGVSG